MLELARSGLTRFTVNRDFRHGYRKPSSSASSAQPKAFEEASARDARLAPLSKIIEGEIIPRLMLAHRPRESLADQPIPAVENVGLEKPSWAEVVALTQLLLKHDALESANFAEALRKKGVMSESIYLELIAPTARHLGELWEADECDFVEVTIALGRLHQVLRLLSLTDGNCGLDDQPLHDRNKVLLASVSGEQHSLGLAIVAEFFQRAGWDVCSGFQNPNPDLPAIVRSEWFDAIGFSAGCECRLDGLASCICSVRAASLNENVAILVGGALFVEHPEFVALVGADASALDARQAVVAAEELVALRR